MIIFCCLFYYNNKKKKIVTENKNKRPTFKNYKSKNYYKTYINDINNNN